MGIWDFINYGKETVNQYTPGPVKTVCNTSYCYTAAAVRKIDDVVRVNGLQKLGQYMSDDEGRAKIVSFSTKFVKKISVYAVKEAASYIIPGGKAVTKIYSETIREVETEHQKKRERSCIEEITSNSNKNTTGGGPVKLLDGAEKLERSEQELQQQLSSEIPLSGEQELSRENRGGVPVTNIYSKTIHEVETECQKKQDSSCIKEITGDSNKNSAGDGPVTLLDGAEMLGGRELELSCANRSEVDSFPYQTPEDAIRVFMMKEFMGTRFLDDLLVPNHGKKKV